MKRISWSILLGVACMAIALQGRAVGAEPPSATDFRLIAWKDLVPKGWKPHDTVDRAAAAGLKDDDEQARQMMQELRRVLDAAPVVEGLDGVAVRLPGYVVPLEQGRDGLKEFLLVPYYGACIHTPPPPANQIVHVLSPRAVTGFQTMSAVWVHGTLKASRRDNGIGVSGYALELARIEPYKRQ